MPGTYYESKILALYLVVNENLNEDFRKFNTL